MGSVNKAILIGNLGRDAELKYTTSGTAVATLSVATTESWKDKNSGERQEKTEWHRVVVWGKTAENLASYLVKGKQVYIEGRIQTREWEDQDGQKRYTTEIRSDRLTLLGSKGDAPAVETKPIAAVAAAVPSAAELTEDDIPF